MTLAAAEIARIDALLGALGGEACAGTVGAALSRLLPGMALRACDAGDVLEEPFRALAAFDLHLLDTRGHCIRVTADPDEATGILIARKHSA